jgi:DNA-binding transcriptional LysR family regulator
MKFRRLVMSFSSIELGALGTTGRPIESSLRNFDNQCGRKHGTHVESSIMDTLKAYQLLLRIAELRSFSRAAAEAGLSQPRASKVVRELERDLGVQLLVRTTRQVTPTPEGERFIELARNALELLDAGKDAIRVAVTGPSGTLCISAPVGFGQQLVAPVVLDYLAAYPQTEASLDLTDRLVDLTKERLDLAVRIGAVEQSSLRVVRLGQCAMRLVASPRYLAAAGQPRTPADLAQHQCMAYTSWRNGDRWSLSQDDGTQAAIRIAGRYRSSHLPSLADAVRAGIGIANLPAWLIDADLERASVVQVLPAWSPPSIAIHAVLPPGRSTPARTRLFITRLKQHLRTRLRP